MNRCEHDIYIYICNNTSLLQREAIEKEYKSMRFSTSRSVVETIFNFCYHYMIVDYF